MTQNSVSIHAPARGATAAAGCLRLPLISFNPRTREGCDGEGCRDRADN